MGEYTSGASLGFGYSNKDSESSSTQNISEIINTLNQSDFLSQLLGQESQKTAGKTTSVQTNLTPEIMQALTSAIQGTQGDIATARENKAGAVQTGINLSQDAMSAAIAQVIEAGIGNVAQLGSNAGAYNSTVQGKAGAQLGAEAAKTGAQLQLESIFQQQGMANQDLQALLGVLSNLTGQGKGGVITTETNQSGTADSISKQNQSGSQTDIGSSDKNSTIDTESSSSETGFSLTGQGGITG